MSDVERGKVDLSRFGLTEGDVERVGAARIPIFDPLPEPAAATSATPEVRALAKELAKEMIAEMRAEQAGGIPAPEQVDEKTWRLNIFDGGEA